MSPRKRPAFGVLIYFAIAFGLGAYFTFAAVQGDYGLFRRAEIESGEVPVFLAYPEELRQTRRVAAFRDFVLEEIQSYRRQKIDALAP